MEKALGWVTLTQQMLTECVPGTIPVDASEQKDKNACRTPKSVSQMVRAKGGGIPGRRTSKCKGPGVRSEGNWHSWRTVSGRVYYVQVGG